MSHEEARPGTEQPGDGDVLSDDAPTPRGPRRRRRLLAALVVLAAAAALVLTQCTGDPAPDGDDGPGSAYAPRPEIVAEYNGSFEGFSDEAIANIAENAGLMVVNKNNHNGRTDLSAKDVNALSAAAAERARTLSDGARRADADDARTKVLGYFMTQTWIKRFEVGFQPWASQFQDEWLMRDVDDQKIPYYGVGGDPGGSRTPIGYMIDLSNADFRAWAVRSLTEWYRSARYSGIALDSTNALTGSSVRRVLGDGSKSYNEIFCGPTAPVDANGDCERVAAYNAGQETFVQELSESIHAEGGIVNYNGIAPSKARGPSRNLGLLERTDVDSALNEAFCFEASARDKETEDAEFNSIRDDLRIMREQARAGKHIIQVTNYQNEAKNKRYGGYCVGAFMMGWERGHARYVYHANYLQELGRTFPFQPELTLKLGDPVEDADLQAATLTREFEHGWVAVNDDDATAEVTAPFDMVEFRDGKKGDSFAAGDTIEVGERDGRFFLRKDFVDGGYSAGTPTEESARSPRSDTSTRPRSGRRVETAPSASGL